MEQLEQLLVQGCKLYASFEHGRYIVRLQHHQERTMAVLEEHPSFLYAINQAAQRLALLDSTRLASQKSPD